MEPDFFPEELPQNSKSIETDKSKTADAYLKDQCGFNLDEISNWYEQDNYGHPSGNKGTNTVRFYLDDTRQLMWERLIEPVTLNFDNKQEIITENYQGSSKGLWWQPPGLEIEEKSEIYWCSNILTAIAFIQNGLNAISIMDHGNFPDEAIKPYLEKDITWVIVVDDLAANRWSLKKHAKKLREMGESVGAAISSEHDEKADWNDLHKAGKLTEDDIKHYRYLGRVELAENHYDKARVMWLHNKKKTYFVYTFWNSTYSFKIDRSEFEKAKDALDERHPDRALKNEKEAFSNNAKIAEIATFKMDFLYFQQPDNGEDGQYFFRFKFSNNAAEVQLPFPGKTFGGAGDFKKAVMHKTPSALFTGSTTDLDFMYQEWMGRIPKIVKTLDYTGYDRDSGAYVFADYAVEKGQLLKLNKESFFQLKKSGIKTTVDIKQKLNTQPKSDWLNDYQSAFGTGGMVALSWWFGCLFVEQVRQHYRSYPFFEVIGEAGSGKSDMVDFLWKLLGREGESFNPNSSTLAGRTRKMAEVSNLPVVFNETDNEQVAENRHSKQFNWDEQKDLFDGEFGRVTGIKSQDNNTKKPTFKAGLMIVQNIQVVASPAIMSRIIHLQFDRTHHSPEGKLASDRLNMLPVLDVSGFLLHSVQKADAVLKQFEKHFNRHRLHLQRNPKIKLQRIIENHAKIMAFADCLPLVLPVDDLTIKNIQNTLVQMAETRQESLNEDHPVVQQFWATFEYINSRRMGAGDHVEENCANHSATPETEIAVNLEHYRQVCAENKLEIIDTKELRRHLPTSQKRQYIRNEVIRSSIEKRSVRCWIFKR